MILSNEPKVKKGLKRIETKIYLKNGHIIENVKDVENQGSVDSWVSICRNILKSNENELLEFNAGKDNISHMIKYQEISNFLFVVTEV